MLCPTISGGYDYTNDSRATVCEVSIQLLTNVQLLQKLYLT